MSALLFELACPCQALFDIQEPSSAPGGVLGMASEARSSST